MTNERKNTQATYKYSKLREKYKMLTLKVVSFEKIISLNILVKNIQEIIKIKFKK